MTIEFLQDYGNKKKGDKINATSVLSASLIKKGIAKIWVENTVKEAKKETKKTTKKEE